MPFIILIAAAIVLWLIVKAVQKQEKSNFRESYNQRQQEKKERVAQSIIAFQEKLADPFPKLFYDNIPKYVFIDFETTDLPIDYKLPTNERLHHYPFVAQAASLIFNVKGELIDQYSSIVKVPYGAYFHPAAAKVNKLSVEICDQAGCPITDFLSFIKKYLSEDSVVIAHNIQFDNFMLKLEAKRYGVRLPKFKTFCTMKSTVDAVGILKYNSTSVFKLPKLIELVEHAFFEDSSAPQFNLHDAAIDVKLCALCFFKLNLQKQCD